MKIVTALYVLALPLCAIAAPVSIAQDKIPTQANLFNSGMRRESGIKTPSKATIRAPAGVSAKRGSGASRPRLTKGDHLSPLNSAVPPPPSSKKSSHKPKSYLESLAHRLTNKSPFSDSSTVREETKASREDWEPEATIVEWETKASREAYIWVPCFSNDKTLRYHCVRVNTDMLVVTLVLSLIAIIIVIEVWRPISARLRRFRSGHGPIYLDTNEITGKQVLGQKAYMFQEPKLDESIVEESINSQRVTTQAELPATQS